MDGDSIFGLLDFLSDEASRKACLSGLFYGITVVSPLCFMLGLRCSRMYVEFIAIKRMARLDKKAQNNLDKVLADGMTLSRDGRFVMDCDGTPLCRNCIENGRQIPVTDLGYERYRCPRCRNEWRIPLSEQLGRYY